MNKRTWTCPWCSHQHLPPHFNLVDGVARIVDESLKLKGED